MTNNPYGDNIRPFRKWYGITPHDTNELSEVPRAIYIGGAGNIVLEDGTGTTITIAVDAGDIIHFSPLKIHATNTTATDIHGLV